MIAERNDTDRMIGMKDTRDRLGLSTAEVIRLVREGRLRAYRYAGSGVISIGQLSYDTRGLRFRASDIEGMINASRVK